MAEEKDDWLDDLDTPDEKESELGQSDIDALLSGSDDQGPAAGAAEELDQSDIDSLLSGSESVNPAPDGVDELGQSDIDALLSGNELASSTPVAGAVDGGELDQSDIDALLSTPDAPVQEQALADPDQDEIDKLFTDLDDTGEAAESQPFPAAEDIDFGDAFGAVDEAVPPAQSSMPAFDEQEFKLEADFDIPDIPDPTVGMSPDQAAFDEATVPTPTETVSTGKTVPPVAETAIAAHPSGKFVPERKTLLAIGGGVAALIIVAATLFWFKGGGKPAAEHGKETAVEKLQESAAEPEVAHEAPASHAEPPPAEDHPPAPPPAVAPAEAEHHEPQAPAIASGAPTLSDLSVILPEGGTQLAITLDGKDPENDPLEYEFQSMPERGQISGHPPNLLYTPRPDFSDRDSFTIRATDGKHVSRTATVSINRSIAPKVIDESPAPVVPVIPEIPVETAQQPASPPEEEKAPESPPVAPPAPAPCPAPTPTTETIAASNASYTISNSLVIPWGKIWGKGNERPYGGDVRVEILQQPSHGTLQAAKGSPSVYRPDPAFSGKDVIRYRFTQGELKSEAKTITVAVKRKNKAPELQIAPYSAVYNAGDTVFLNASRTTDEARGSVRFHWEQIAGVPVLIKPLNSEESQIAFVAPATFNTVSNPGVVIRVTATDDKGWSASRELFVKTQSRRSSALWR